MALRTAIREFGVTFGTGYQRVIAVDIRKTFAYITVERFVSQEAKDANAAPLPDLSFTCEKGDFTRFFSDPALLPEGKSPLRAAYAYLKTLPIFRGSVDV